MGLGKRSKCKIRCEKHGVVTWRGHIICGGCGRVYQTNDPNAVFYAPETCLCHSRLMPRDDAELEDKMITFSACACCPTCYGIVIRDYDGRLPPPMLDKPATA